MRFLYVVPLIAILLSSPPVTADRDPMVCNLLGTDELTLKTTLDGLKREEATGGNGYYFIFPIERVLNHWEIINTREKRIYPSYKLLTETRDHIVDEELQQAIETLTLVIDMLKKLTEQICGDT